MAGEAGYNESSVVLPSLFGPPGAAIERALDRRQQDKLFDYRIARDKEEDDWRKAQMLKDLTDLDKYQTNVDAANAIGDEKVAEVLQKFASAPNMSYSDLLSGVRREMGAVINSMTGLKNEMALGDQQLMALKQKFPSIDIGRLAKDMRTEIAGRRVQNGKFVNPLEVAPSQLRLDDPEFLSDYVLNDKALQEGIINPKGMQDVGAVAGNPVDNISFKGKRPFFKENAFTDEDLKKGGGMLPKGTIPRLKIKEKEISTDVLKGKDGKALMGVPDEILEQYSDGEGGLQLLFNTKRDFPNYKELSPQQKHAAQSATLRKMLELNTSDYTYDRNENRTPPRITVNAGGGGSGSGLQLNTVFPRIKEALRNRRDQGQQFLPAELLKQDEADVVLKAIRNRYTTDEKKEIALGDYKLIEGDDGTVRVFDKTNDDFVTFIGEEAADVPTQVSVKEKREKLRQIEENKNKSTYRIKGKDYSEKALLDMGYTIDQIRQYKK